jgi:ABC-type phosphate/phosphonate transport system substrate-binding protein
MPTWLPLITLMVLLVWHHPSWGADNEGAPFHLRIGFSGKSFVNVPRDDIRVAVQVLSRKVARKTVGSAESKIYDSQAEIERDLKSKMLDVVALTPEEFIHLRESRLLEPLMTTMSGNSHEFRLLLLARRDGQFRRVSDLKKKQLSIPSSTAQYGSMYQTWLNTLVMREGASSPRAYFSSIRETRNAPHALMSVFFRQADACIVTDQTYVLTSELNPQIAMELVALASYDRLAGGVIAIRHDLPAERKQRVRNALMTLHEDQEGQQMFVMFQLSRLIPFRPDHLKGMESLFAEYQNLRARMVRR